MYGEFKESVKNLMNAKASHRYLALRRGWQEEELKVGIEADDQKLLSSFEAKALSVENQIVKAFLKESAKISLQVHVLPSVVNELHRVLKENADDHAIQVFSNNLKKVLMGSPFGPKVVIVHHEPHTVHGALSFGLSFFDLVGHRISFRFRDF